jgi:FkbM family methyltransferase
MLNARVLLNLLRICRHGGSFGRRATIAAYLRIEMRRALLARRRDVHSERLWGQELFFPDYESFGLLFDEMYMQGTYLFRATSDRPHIIDCGANIGLATAFFLTQYREATIIAFEPDAEAFRFLDRNREHNQWRGVTLHHTAVHRDVGALTFYSHAQASVVSGFRRGLSGAAPSQVLEIPTVRLSSYIDRPVDLLKLDVEGSEIPVFEELAESGKMRLIDQMIMEYHHHIDPDEDRLGYLLALLERNGFGYDLRATASLPFSARRPHNFMLYAYRK